MESIEVLTNDPTAPALYLTLHADVPQDLTVRPERLYMVCKRGDSPIQRLRLTGPETAWVKRASAREASLFLEVNPVEGPEPSERGWDITVAVSPNLPIGRTEDELRIETTHAARPLVTVPVMIEVEPQIRRVPSKLFFGFVQPGKTAKRTLTLRSFDGRAFDVSGATAGEPGVTAGAQRVSEGEWKVEVSLTRAEPGVVETTFVVTTDLPGEERIEVPLYADVRATP